MSLESKLENSFHTKMLRANSVSSSEKNKPGELLQTNDIFSKNGKQKIYIEEVDADDESSRFEDSDCNSDGVVDAL